MEYSYKPNNIMAISDFSSLVSLNEYGILRDFLYSGEELVKVGRVLL